MKKITRKNQAVIIISSLLLSGQAYANNYTCDKSEFQGDPKYQYKINTSRTGNSFRCEGKGGISYGYDTLYPYSPSLETVKICAQTTKPELTVVTDVNSNDAQCTTNHRFPTASYTLQSIPNFWGDDVHIGDKISVSTCDSSQPNGFKQVGGTQNNTRCGRAFVGYTPTSRIISNEFDIRLSQNTRTLKWDVSKNKGINECRLVTWKGTVNYEKTYQPLSGELYISDLNDIKRLVMICSSQEFINPKNSDIRRVYKAQYTYTNTSGTSETTKHFSLISYNIDD